MINETNYCLPVMDTVKTAWAKVSGVKGSFWAVLGIFLLVLIITGVFASFTGPDLTVLMIVINVFSSLVQLIATASLLYLGIRRAQDMPVSYKLIKDVMNMRTILSIIGLYILQILIYIPALIIVGVAVGISMSGHIGISMSEHLSTMEATPVELSSHMQWLAGIAYLAAAVIFIYLTVRMWLAYGEVLDKKLNPWQAIKLSFKATRGNVLNLIGLFMISIVIIFGCTLTLGIGYIWGLPWLMITYGEAYKRLSTRQDMRPIG